MRRLSIFGFLFLILAGCSLSVEEMPVDWELALPEADYRSEIKGVYQNIATTIDGNSCADERSDGQIRRACVLSDVLTTIHTIPTRQNVVHVKRGGPEGYKYNLPLEDHTDTLVEIGDISDDMFPIKVIKQGALIDQFDLSVDDFSMFWVEHTYYHLLHVDAFKESYRIRLGTDGSLIMWHGRHRNTGCGTLIGCVFGPIPGIDEYLHDNWFKWKGVD